MRERVERARSRWRARLNPVQRRAALALVSTLCWLAVGLAFLRYDAALIWALACGLWAGAGLMWSMAAPADKARDSDGDG